VSGHVAGHLSAYVDGALGVRDLERVRAHLEVCPVCLREYGELRALRSLLRGLPDPAAPDGLDERMHWRLAREAARGGGSRLRRFLLSAIRHPARLRTAVACAALLVALTLPWGWVQQWGAREAPLDTDAYLRDYIVLSSDRPLTDDVATTLVTSTVLTTEPQYP
jgi:anti-sigma factor RsiW